MSRKQPLKVAFGLLPKTICLASYAICAIFVAQINSVVASDGDEAPVMPAAEPGPLELRALDYIWFRQDISGIESMSFDNEKITRNAHMRLSAHDSWALTSGWMAYAALIAADTPAFALAMQAELRGEHDLEPEKKKKRKKKKKKQKELTEAELETARAAFLAKLSADPRYPRTMPGAQEAIDAILELARNDKLRVTSLGENFKTQAYAMQKTRWGKRRLGSAQTRLSEAEAYRNSRPGIPLPQFQATKTQGVYQPRISDLDAPYWQQEWGYPSSSTSFNEGSRATMDRILNLAARYSVGALNDKIVRAYAKSSKTEQCLSISRLTLNQCIAATRTPYEEAFCLGEHAINDVAECSLGKVIAN